MKVSVILAIPLFCLVSCDGEGNSSEYLSSDDVASAPLEGREVTKEGQLVGMWFRASEGNYLGIEFLRDGKAMLTRDFAVAGNPAITVTFQVLDGGRLAFVAANGQTETHHATVTGDLLEIRPESSGFAAGEPQRFRRLESGRTIAQALADEEREQKERAKRSRALFTMLLEKDDLVLAPVEGDVEGPSLALQSSGQAAFVAGPPAVKWLVQTGLQDGDRPGSVRFALELAQVLGPPGASGAPSIRYTLEAHGHLDDLRLTGVHHGITLELRQDAELHGEILAAYSDAEDAAELAIAPLADLLKTRAELRGNWGQSGVVQQEVAIVLVRRSGVHAYESPTPGTTATIELRGQTPLLIGKHAYRYDFEVRSANEGGGTLLRGTYGGQPCTLEVVEALDDNELVRRREVIQGFVDDELGPGATFRATIHGQFGPRYAVVDAPALFELTVAEDGKVIGSASYPTLGGEVQLDGRLQRSEFDHELNINGKMVDIPRSFNAMHPFSPFKNQSWQLLIEMSEAEGEPTLTGSGRAGREGTIKLIRPDEATFAREQRTIEEHLVDGAVLLLKEPSGVGKPMQIELTLDPESRAITGTATEGVAHELRGPGTLDGRLEKGPAFWHVRLDYEPDPTIRRAVPLSFDLVYVPGQERFTLAGPRIVQDQRIGPTRFVSAAEPDDAEPSGR